MLFIGNQLLVAQVFQGYYTIVARHSGKVMDVKSYSKDNGGDYHTWEDANTVNQFFSFEKAGNGYYYIRGKESGKYVTLNAQRTGLTQWEKLHHDIQKFRIERNQDGFYAIFSKFNNKRINVANGKKNNGASYNFEGSKNKSNEFELRPVDPDLIRHNYTISIKNKSIWDVEYRVKTAEGWSDWIKGRDTQYILGGPLLSIEVMWKDGFKWKHIPGLPIISRNQNNYKYIITGDLFNKISMD